MIAENWIDIKEPIIMKAVYQKRIPSNHYLIGCDIDGVISDCANDMLEFNIKSGIIPESARLAVRTSQYGIENNFDNFSFDCFDDELFWENMTKFNQSDEFVKRLHRCGEVTFVSASRAQIPRTKWLIKHGYADKYVTCKSSLKAEYAKDNGFNIFIEDHPRTVQQLLDIGIERVYFVNPFEEKVKNNGQLFAGSLMEVIVDIERYTGVTK